MSKRKQVTIETSIGLDHLGYLATLILEKNQLNRERRRFWNILNNLRMGKVVKGISRSQAERGYKQSREEMMNLTPIMRKVCKQLGVSLVWNNSWMVHGIRVPTKDFGWCGYIHLETIKALATEYEINEILLG